MKTIKNLTFATLAALAATLLAQTWYDGGVGIGNCFDVTLNIIKRNSKD